MGPEISCWVLRYPAGIICARGLIDWDQSPVGLGGMVSVISITREAQEEARTHWCVFASGQHTLCIQR